MKRAPWIVTALVVLGVAAWIGARACGPDTTDAHFEALDVPDTKPEDFAAGRLGILRPGFSFQNRVMAYRWLSGLGVSLADQRILTAPAPEYAAPDAAHWIAARSLVLKEKAPLPLERYSHRLDWADYPRLTQGALDTAAATLTDRLSLHGDGADLRAWIAAQDQVFASTKEHPSIPAPVAAPAWLKLDRVYQIAAAHFYAEQFDEARAEFTAIAKDPASPWRAWAPYLAARCLVRKAGLAPEVPDGPVPAPEAGQPPAAVATHPDPVLWEQARAATEDVVAHSAEGQVRNAALALLDLTRHHTDPAALWRDDLQALASVKEGLAPLVDSAKWAGRERNSEAEGATGAGGDLEAWLSAMEAGGDSSQPYEQWRAKGGIPWLTAAIAVWPRLGTEADELVAAAAKVPDTDPAAPTLHWNVLRLRLMALQGAELRAALDAALKQDWPDWARNELKRRRGPLAENLQDWAATAVHDATGFRLSLDNEVIPARAFPVFENNYSPATQLFDKEEAGALNHQMSCLQIAEVAKAPGIPSPLRDELSRVAWLRAAMLDKWEDALRMTPSLEPALKDKARVVGAIQDPEARRFALAQMVMAFPGLRPTVNVGLGDFREGEDVAVFDGVRDNWWCGNTLQVGTAGSPLTFLKDDELKTAAEEREKIMALPAAQIWFGHIVLDHAKAHPEDPSVPDALARVVATTRSPMCEGADVSEVSREAFHLLHTSYKDTAAAKRTKYHY